MPSPIAVIDIGSNTGRAVVLGMTDSGHLETLADGHAPLRLARDVGNGQELSERAIARTVEVLRDFRAIAASSGASPVVAVATAAVRSASNRAELVARAIRDAGIQLVVLDGESEARLSFLGAVRSLPVRHGLSTDVGGGSIEVSQFSDRALVRSWTLPLGSLLLSDRFLRSDPPTKREIDELCAHVTKELTDAGVPALTADESLIGTGGTIRNLAKIDRHRRTYPIPRIHGYVLTRNRLQSLADLLGSRSLARRRSIPGLNDDRVDSIVGGILVATTVMDVARAEELMVSGQGLREGMALDAVASAPPSPEQVRRASVAAMTARFATWDADRAARRSAAALTLFDELEPDAGEKARERLRHASTILDIGRSIDYYRRHEHTADMLVAADLAGFSHRMLALLAAVVRQAGDPGTRVRAYRPLLAPDDQAPVARMGTILALADEIEHRLPPGGAEEVRCTVRGRTVTLDAPIFDPWRRQALVARFAKAFRKRLVIQPDGGGERDA